MSKVLVLFAPLFIIMLLLLIMLRSIFGGVKLIKNTIAAFLLAALVLGYLWIRYL